MPCSLASNKATPIRYNCPMRNHFIRLDQNPGTVPVPPLATLVVIVALMSPVSVGAQAAAPSAAAPPVSSAAADGGMSWRFGAAQSADSKNWTAERGTIAQGNDGLRLQPDANRRVILLSPSALPEAARRAEEFQLGISGTGLQRARIQARRDERGGWITIADASGSALREIDGGYAIKRNAGARDAPIERLRIELQFRTTNPRALKFIAIKDMPG